MNAAAYARSQAEYDDAEDRLIGEPGDADYLRLYDLRPKFVTACRQGDLIPYEVANAAYKEVIDAALKIRTSIFQKLIPVWPFYADESVELRDRLIRLALERLQKKHLTERDWYRALLAHNRPIIKEATDLCTSALNNIAGLAQVIKDADPRRQLPSKAKGGTPPAGSYRGIPLAEAEIKVREWLAANAKGNPAAVTRDAVAAGTGVSTAQVSRTAAWQAFRDKRDAESKPGAREVPLTDDMQAAATSGCPLSNELAYLIEEQRADEAEQERRYKRRT